MCVMGLTQAGALSPIWRGLASDHTLGEVKEGDQTVCSGNAGDETQQQSAQPHTTHHTPARVAEAARAAVTE
jgi:hypothetical protein